MIKNVSKQKLFQCSKNYKVKNEDDPPGTLENVWVDGDNTFHDDKSDMPSPEEVAKIREGPKFGF